MSLEEIPSENPLLRLIFGISIIIILSSGFFFSTSVDGVPYTFERTVEFQEETEISVNEYPYPEEIRITADNLNTDEISFLLKAIGYDYIYSKNYSLAPGENISSLSDVYLCDDISLTLYNTSSIQKVHILAKGRSNYLEELLGGLGGFPHFNSLAYFIYFFLPSFVVSLILFLYLIFSLLYIPPDANKEERKIDRAILIHTILPVLLFILYLIVSQSIGLMFFLPLPTMIFFYYCIESVILNSFFVRLNFRYSFWRILGGTLLISSVFFFILYSPFTFTVMNEQKVWNTLPILPLNISFFLSGMILLVYDYYRSSLQQFIS